MTANQVRQARRIALAALVLLLLSVVAGWTKAALMTQPPSAELRPRHLCTAYDGLPPDWRSDKFSGMKLLSGGRFALGSIEGYPEERPVRQAEIRAFWLDETEVTNAQFAAFIEATGYVTDAEREGRGVVFRAPLPGANGTDQGWWHHVAGANWRHPDGPSSSLEGLSNHPVVQVTRDDASAYARWLGRRLPTEAEWEYAAKANGASEQIERGPRDAEGRPLGNFWQGNFPFLNVREDGYADRAPVGCYEANGYGLFDMIGNVWEWTSDPWTGSHQGHGTGAPHRVNAAAVTAVDGLIKGGSFLCSADFCVRYRASARHPQDTTLGAVHVGFRTALSH